MLKQILDIHELLDRADTNGELVKKLFLERGLEESKFEIIKLESDTGIVDFLRIIIEGRKGKTKGGDSPTLGVTGRLGGLGARPELIGFVSDGDGALSALGVALKLVEMREGGDVLEGDVVITTHISANAPTIPHYPVPMMSSHVDIEVINKLEVEHDIDAVLSVDTTKGNKVMNHNGFAISCTVKEGYILKASDDLLEIMIRVTGKMPKVFALSQQDITPYGNGLHHLNSILQPSIATDVPVVGVAITTEQPVAGCATGATHIMDVESSARFILEVAKDYTKGICDFYDKEEYGRILKQYGKMTHFQLKDMKKDK